MIQFRLESYWDEVDTHTAFWMKKGPYDAVALSAVLITTVV